MSIHTFSALGKKKSGRRFYFHFVSSTPLPFFEFCLNFLFLFSLPQDLLLDLSLLKKKYFSSSKEALRTICDLQFRKRCGFFTLLTLSLFISLPCLTPSSIENVLLSKGFEEDQLVLKSNSRYKVNLHLS